MNSEAVWQHRSALSIQVSDTAESTICFTQDSSVLSRMHQSLLGRERSVSTGYGHSGPTSVGLYATARYM